MSEPTYDLILDAQGVVVGAGMNRIQPGAVEVDAAAYAQAAVGTTRYVDGQIQPYTPPPSDDPPAVCGDAIIGVIAKADRAKCDPTDLARIAWRDDVPTSNAKLGRIARAIGTTPDALRSAAQSVS